MSAGGQREGRILREFARHRQALIADLNSQFGALHFSALDSTAIAVENFLFEAIRRLICAEAQNLFGANKTDEDARLFSCGATEYHINITDAVLQPDRLLIAILPHELGALVHESELNIREVKIAGYGRYRQVTIHIPRRLKADWQLLDHVIKNVVETIYDWVHVHILRHVALETQAAATELYRYARTKFFQRDVWQKLWFGAMSDGRGFRLFEEFVAASAFDTVREHAAEFGRGANDTVAEILNTNLPLEQLLMRHVIGRQNPINVDISKAAYHKQQSTYSEAMRSLYGSTEFAIYPILTDVDYPDKVIALYPTSLKSEIEPVLRANRNDFRDIAQNSQKKIRDTLKAMRMLPKQTSVDSGAAAIEFTDNLSLDHPQRIVLWNGKTYITSEMQFACICVFYDLAKKGTKMVNQRYVLDAVGSESERLRDLFKGHGLFGTLIRDEGRGYFSLAIDPPNDEQSR